MLEFSALKSVMVAINLLILYMIYKRFVFKPVTEFMENRTRSIRESIEEAERNKLEAAGLKKTYEDHISEIEEEAQRVLGEARADAYKEVNSIIEAAKLEAESIKAAARKEMEQERVQMLKEIRSEVAELALAAASKVIEANMDTPVNRVIVDRFINEAGAA